MSADSARKGEIAYKYLKYILKEQGLEVDRHFRRHIGNVAKDTEIPFGEALEFAIQLAREILDEVSKVDTPPTPSELEGGFHGHGHGGH